MVGSIYTGEGHSYRTYRCGSRWHSPERVDCANKYRMLSARLAEDKVWSWFTGLMEDEQDFDEALDEMEESKKSEAEPKMQRLEAINELIDKVERNIKRLARDSREAENDYIADTLKGELKIAGKKRDDLISERERIESALAVQVITEDARNLIRAKAEEIRKRLINPTCQQKRALLDLFDFKVIFRIDESGRWLDVSCGLKPEGDVIALDHCEYTPYIWSGSRTSGKRERSTNLVE